MAFVSVGSQLKEKPLPGFTLEKVIFVEGQDEVHFFHELLKYDNITDTEVWDYEGKSKLAENLDAYKTLSGFKNVKSIGIIQDADKNASSAFQSVGYIVSQRGFSVPVSMNTITNTNPKIGIFIITSSTNSGMLEDLCLSTVITRPAMKCVNDFWTCSSKLDPPPKNPSKAKAHAYLASMPELVPSIGIGAKKKYWDFTSNVLNDLKSFINNL